MAYYFDQPSRTFGEYLLVPGYSSSECVPDAVSLKTPLVKYRKGQEDCPLTMNIPMISAIMQSVSGPDLAIALAKQGGVSFIFGSQSIESEAEMVRKVKSYKKGFVTSDSNLKPSATLADVLALKEKTGHSTVAVTEDGTAHGKLVGIVASRDYRISRMALTEKVADFMTPLDKLVIAPDTTTLKEANDIIWDNKINSLPLVDKNGCLKYMVFRKDYDSHKENVNELLDAGKSYVVGAGINTRDYAERVPALVEAGVDVLCIDSSEGFTEWQSRTIDWIRAHYGDKVKVGAGNVVDRDGFRFLAEAGADFVKIGIGGGSICITRETKGIGRGQATAVIEVAKARDEYYKETGIYVPICSDGGIVHDYHITLALAMGADFVMLGRYFARFDESPTNKVRINGQYMKEYWGEGSNRARNWQRYDLGGATKLSFEEGVDSYVPYAGSLADGVTNTLYKVRSTMCNCGALSIEELQQKARLTVVSSTSIVEGGSHDVVLKNNTNA
ncbi:MAG TPA: IMP dehydrogenase [Candidatus Fournierella excrementavium]|uniref:IMP dehydrogenase n=1 Tax=Allofournierella TaxID=1940255 RepID=UPI001F95AED4|nr:IMP dehydrogenase [Fournierella sp.]MEE0757924.1 IMP dehydrogenase [Fournierella sp.]HJD17807.1 IMP dehydrogenase [Candidatus Fournierella excrementavium]